MPSKKPGSQNSGSSGSGIAEDTPDVWGQLPREPAPIMEELVMTEDSHLRIDSLQDWNRVAGASRASLRYEDNRA